MPKEEWGVKRLCPSCATRFYDLRMDPLTCPSCNASFTVESLNASKPKALRPDKAANAPAEQTPADDLPDIPDPDDDDIESDDDLLEDDDDEVSLEEIADVGSDSDDD